MLLAKSIFGKIINGARCMTLTATGSVNEPKKLWGRREFLEKDKEEKMPLICVVLLLTDRQIKNDV